MLMIKRLQLGIILVISSLQELNWLEGRDGKADKKA